MTCSRLRKVLFRGPLRERLLLGNYLQQTAIPSGCSLLSGRQFLRRFGSSPSLRQRQPPSFLPLPGSSSDTPQNGFSTPSVKSSRRSKRPDPPPPVDLRQFSLLLEKEGFTSEQADALIALVSEAITEKCAIYIAISTQQCLCSDSIILAQ
jgi:hypothetical protein